MTDQPDTPLTATTPTAPADGGAAPSTDPVEAPTSAPPLVAAPDVAVGEGTPAAPGWYPVAADGGLRYWDGSAWRELTAPEPASASYGDKWKRRYPVVLLVLAAFNTLSGLAGAAAGNKLDLGWSTGLIWVVSVVMGVTLFSGAAVWSCVAAAFRGRPISKEERAAKPFWRKAWTWVPVGVVAVVVSTTLLFKPAADVAPITVTSEAQGCTQFLATFVDAAEADASVLGAKTWFQPLHDAATGSAPKLAKDLETFLSNPTEASLSSMTESVVTRCVTDGALTESDVQAFGQRLQALGG